MHQEDKAAWDQYYAAAIIAVASTPKKDTGSPLDNLSSTPQALANKAAMLADLMLAERRTR